MYRLHSSELVGNFIFGTANTALTRWSIQKIPPTPCLSGIEAKKSTTSFRFRLVLRKDINPFPIWSSHQTSLQPLPQSGAPYKKCYHSLPLWFSFAKMEQFFPHLV